MRRGPTRLRAQTAHITHTADANAADDDDAATGDDDDDDATLRVVALRCERVRAGAPLESSSLLRPAFPLSKPQPC